MSRLALAFCLLLTGLSLTAHAGCRSSRIDTLCAAIAEELTASIQVRLDRSAAIMVVSFVDLHRMEQTSNLGRVLSEAIGDNFHQYGYRVVEPRLRARSVTTHNQNGEFALSRDLNHLDDTIEIQAILTGTYAISDAGVLISARLVHAEDKSVLASAQCQLRLTPEVAALMNSAPAPTAVQTRALINLHSKADARLVQKKLQDLGLYRAKIDGTWGRRSANALRQFKSIRGLPALPEWDQTTQDALLPLE